MYCRKCGAQIPDTSRFCRSCGAEQKPPKTPPPVRPPQPKPASDDRTVRVRQPKPGTPPAAPHSAKKPRRKSGSALLIAVVVCCLLVLLALAALVWFVVFSDSGRSEPDPTAMPTAQIATPKPSQSGSAAAISPTVSPAAAATASPSPTTTPAAATPTPAALDEAALMTDDNCPFTVHAFGYMLLYRLGPGTDYDQGDTYVKGIQHIVQVKSGPGSTAGWGLLESGTGWISLDYCDYYEPGSPARMDEADCPYTIEIRFSILNVRSGPGTNYSVISDDCLPKGTYTITQFSSGTGSSAGWGKLANGGWIALDYCRIVD